MSINRLADYFKDNKETTGKTMTDIEKTLQAANEFFKSITGCRTDAVYLQLCKMVIAAVRSQSTKGTEKMVVNSFKIMLDRELKAQEGGGQNGNS